MPAPPTNRPLSNSILSRDPAVITAYENDPLVYRGPIPKSFPMGATLSRLYDIVPQIKLPVLIMAGNGVKDGENSRNLYERIGSADRTLKVYDGLKHEIFNEPEYLQVLADLESWLSTHL